MNRLLRNLHHSFASRCIEPRVRISPACPERPWRAKLRAADCGSSTAQYFRRRNVNSL